LAANSLFPNVEQGDLPLGKPKRRVRNADPNLPYRVVMILAMSSAKRAVEKDIRAEGKRLSDFSMRQIRELAEGYFAGHMDELITEAVEVYATWPGFARWRSADFDAASVLKAIRNRTLAAHEASERRTNHQ
jgi:hypothetical protein